MAKKKGRRTTEAVGVLTKERVRAIRRRRTRIARREGAKGYKRHMMKVHQTRRAKRAEHRALAPALHARASRRVPMMVSSMVGSPSPRKFGVYGKGFVLQWFPTRKTRRTFITEHPAQIQWKWPQLERVLFGSLHGKRKQRRLW